MVAGVFTARWTFPTLLKGTAYVVTDLAEKKHLIVWALLAGALWAVANTLAVFAIRDVGLAVAFPMWNANSLIGLLWGRFLFRELEGASGTNIAKVVVGAIAMVIAAIMLDSAHSMARARPEAMPRVESSQLSAQASCGAPCTFPIARPTSAV
jgi:glucose uptake protein GlcU